MRHLRRSDVQRQRCRCAHCDNDRGVLDAPAARKRGLFNQAYVDRLLANPEGELTPKGHSKLWQIALLECWLQTQGI